MKRDKKIGVSPKETGQELWDDLNWKMRSKRRGKHSNITQSMGATNGGLRREKRQRDEIMGMMGMHSCIDRESSYNRNQKLGPNTFDINLR